MRLSPVLVEHIAAQIVSGLIKEKLIEVEDEPAARAAVAAAFAEDLSVEDRLNDEVREILRTHSDDMTRRGVQYHEMFKMVKAELARKRKLIL
ncbi:MAG TPA: DUF507 family protein [Candidatus Polarisedimenticolia bacterium]|nr:DUF507 family protein [Candidatus Polarisedimenticolia bacterium]